MVEETNPDVKKKIEEQGYESMARGICECGIVYVLCVQPLPASPTFSLFFDVYQPTDELIEIRKKLISKQVV